MSEIKRENELARKYGGNDSNQNTRRTYNSKEEAIDVIAHGNSLVPKKFDYFEPTYTNDCITKVDYYSGKLQNISEVTMINDVSKSLAGTYFVFYTLRDRVKYYVWYKVGGTGIDPSVANATGIQVNISENDYAPVIALATKYAIEAVTNIEFYFRIQTNGSTLIIINNQAGTCTETTDGDSGFTFETTQTGSVELVASLDLTYDSDSCLTSVTGFKNGL